MATPSSALPAGPRRRVRPGLVALAALLAAGPVAAQDEAPGPGTAAARAAAAAEAEVPFFLRPFRTAWERLRADEEVTDPDDRRLRGDAEALARAQDADRQRTAPTGGLRAFSDEAEAEPVPGDRFRTAGQRRADDLEEERRQALVGVTLRAGADGLPVAVADEDIVTGSVDGGADGDGAGDGEDPWEPLGLRAGPLTFRPSIDVVAGYDSDVDGGGEAARTLRIAPRLRLETDWVRHELTADVAGRATLYDDGRDWAPALDAEAALRLDLGLETTATVRGAYALAGEAQDDPDVPGAADGRTDTQTLRGGIDLSRRVGPVEVTAGGQAERFLFGDTPVAGGPDTSNDDRVRTDWTASLRVERAEGPLVRPFVEGTATLRRFDEALDRNGFARDSLAWGATVGVALADRAPLRGSVGVGLLGERFEDYRLDDVVALAAQAELQWDVTALTTATLALSTTLDPTTQAGAGVGITRGATFGLTHQLRRDFELRASAGVSDTDFSGIAAARRIYTGTAGATWTLSRSVAARLDGTVEHEPDATSGEETRFALEAGVTLRR